MRMWMLDPKLICRKHLIGAHGELHKHRHNFEKQHKIDGRIYPIVQIEPPSMKKRHDELAEEMIRRGMNHNSPYEQPDISYLPEEQQKAKVDIEISKIDLMNRCEDCKHNLLSVTNLSKSA